MTNFSSDKSLIQAWSDEYHRKGIPSSFRKDPTEALVQFMAWCHRNSLPSSGFAADIGCGQGRNSYYLASHGFHVTALDLLQANIDSVNNESQSKNLPIRAFTQNAAATWPIESHSLDIAVDIFCYKHITHKAEQQKYRRELWRTLKPSGYYFISLASIDDGFYGQLLTDSPNRDQNLVIDPQSQIPSFLYSLDELMLEFSDGFSAVKLGETYSTSPMHGKEYSRVVLNCIFKKQPAFLSSTN